MTKSGIIFFTLCLLLVIMTGIYCASNNSKSEKPIISAKQIVTYDTIIDPIIHQGCGILLQHKDIAISHKKAFPKKSTGYAVLNVVISRSGNLDSLKLIFLKIVKGKKEIYLFDQSIRDDGKCPKDIEFICKRINDELHNAVITCIKGNNKETRLRIPIKIEFK